MNIKKINILKRCITISTLRFTVLNTRLNLTHITPPKKEEEEEEEEEGLDTIFAILEK